VNRKHAKTVLARTSQAQFLGLEACVWVEENDASLLPKGQEEGEHGLNVRGPVLKQGVEYCYLDLRADASDCPQVSEVGNNFRRDVVLFAIYDEATEFHGAGVECNLQNAPGAKALREPEQDSPFNQV